VFLDPSEDRRNRLIQFRVTDDAVPVLVDAWELQEIDGQLTVHGRTLNVESRIAPGKIVRGNAGCQRQRHHEGTKGMKDTKE
jgi:hypothetical protein